MVQFKNEINKNFTWIDKVPERRDVQLTTSATWQAAELEFLPSAELAAAAPYFIVI